MLVPYEHEVDGNRTACADDCPACLWYDQHVQDSDPADFTTENTINTKEPRR
jgi:hypothetical protein